MPTPKTIRMKIATDSKCRLPPDGERRRRIWRQVRAAVRPAVGVRPAQAIARPMVLLGDTRSLELLRLDRGYLPVADRHLR